MYCSSVKSGLDLFLWSSPGIKEAYQARYANYSPGDPYDCWLNQAPCHSNFTQLFFSFSDDVVFWFDVLVVHVFTSLIVVVGVVSNIVNILIFCRYVIASASTNALLLCLAVSDLIIVLSLLATYLYGDLVNRSFNILSQNLVAAISIQRAIAVFFPFKVSTWFSLRNTQTVIGVLVAITLATMVPVIATFKPVELYHHYFKGHVALGANLFIMIDYTNIYRGILNGTSLGSIVIAVSLTAFKLFRQARSRQSLKATKGSAKTDKALQPAGDEATAKKAKEENSHMSSREMKAIKMSLTVCVVTFIVASAGNATYLIIQEVRPIGLIHFLMSLILNAIYGVNTCANFFIYVFMSPKYREGFWHLFGLKKAESAVPNKGK